MTMQGTTKESSSMKEISSIGGINTKALDVTSVRSIQLADGWHNVEECNFIQFAVGEAHSPVIPTKLYPTLWYVNEFGQQTFTPLGSILSYSEDTYEQGAKSNQTSQQQGQSQRSS